MSQPRGDRRGRRHSLGPLLSSRLDFGLLGAASLCLFSGCTTLDVLGARAGSSSSSPSPSDPATPSTGGVGGAAAIPAPPPPLIPNVIEERTDVPVSVVNAQLNEAFLQLFYGDPNNQAVYTNLGDGTGYVEDIANGDVRADAMGYGMLVTVQLDQRDVFDNLWAWSREHLVVSSGPGAGLLRWRCLPDGTECADSSATDSSSVVATSLFLAEQRWGDAGRHDYSADGLSLLEAMTSVEERNGGVVDGWGNGFDLQRALPRRSSDSQAEDVAIDYLMPAFYDLWAREDETRAALWSGMADNARQLLQRGAHEDTGLWPEVVDYDGAPVPGFADYQVTTARAYLNLMIDLQWGGYAADLAWLVEDNERRLDFFLQEGIDDYVSSYTLFGEPLLDYNTSAHRALVALAAGTSTDARYDVFIDRLLSEPIPEGIYRYYDGMMVMLSLLVLSGQFTAPAL